MNFSVEMETGAGKTYVYLRTIQELFKRSGPTGSTSVDRRHAGAEASHSVLSAV